MLIIITLSSYKLFFNGKEIDKEDCIANIDNIFEGSTIYASEGVGKPFKFSRFPEFHSTYRWSNSGRYSDGLAFIPSQNIRLCGFSTCAAKDESQYEMKYQVTVDGTEVEKETIIASGWEDEYYYRHRLNGIYPVMAGQKFEIIVWIAKSLASNTDVTTYRGTRGEEYDKVENEHMGLFKLEYASSSDNGTSINCGHFPEIFYFLG